MKEDELRANAVCSICKNKIGQAMLPSFWTLDVERHMLNLDALERQQGLTMMLGGHAGLAGALGPNEDMTRSVLKKHLSVCERCASKLFSTDDQISTAIFAEDEVSSKDESK